MRALSGRPDVQAASCSTIRICSAVYYQNGQQEKLGATPLGAHGFCTKGAFADARPLPLAGAAPERHAGCPLLHLRGGSHPKGQGMGETELAVFGWRSSGGGRFPDPLIQTQRTFWVFPAFCQELSFGKGSRCGGVGSDGRRVKLCTLDKWHFRSGADVCSALPSLNCSIAGFTVTAVS